MWEMYQRFKGFLIPMLLISGVQHFQALATVCVMRSMRRWQCAVLMAV